MAALSEEFADLARQITRFVRETGTTQPSRRRSAEFCGMRFDIAATEKPDLFMLVCPNSNWAVEFETIGDRSGLASFEIIGDVDACHRDLIYVRMAVEK
jgi:hypothetical protein